MKTRIIDRLPIMAFFTAVFLFIMIWCGYIHPVQIFNADDWAFSYKHREAMPIWGAWNPIRVFPEVFMPLVSTLGAFLVYPVTGDFFGSFTVAYAAAASAAVVLLLYVVYKDLLQKGASDGTALLLALFFLICHFWVMRSAKEGNKYMLHAQNATCVFFYLIPNLLCSAWVLWTHRSRILRGGKALGNARIAAWIFLTYFCIFSNLWSNLILGTYLGTVLLLALAGQIREHAFRLRLFLRQYWPELLLLFLWVVSQVYEKNGGRAANIADTVNESFRSAFYVARQVYLKNLTYLNRGFLISTLIVITAGTAILLKTGNKTELRELLGCGIAFVISSVYLILSCSVTGPSFLYRPEVFYSAFFYYMLAVLLCAVRIFRQWPRLITAAPLLLMLILANCHTKYKTFPEYNEFFEPETCRRISEDILGQLQQADRDGLTEITLYVPKFETEDNWPIAHYAEEHLYLMPYVYKATGREIIIKEFVPTYEKNAVLFPQTESVKAD